VNRRLIVIDMQNDFVSGSLGSEAAADILPKVEKRVESFDGEVLFTKDTHDADYLNTQEGKKLPVSHCIRGSEGWKLAGKLEELAEKTGAAIYEKGTFGSLKLGERLAEENSKEPIDSVEFMGVCTDICVISNAMILKAYLPETEMIVNASCCAGVTEKSHENALDAMRACQITVI
jgi:nicotinamidase-related amidase